MPFPVQYVGANPFALQAGEQQGRLDAIREQLMGQGNLARQAFFP